MEVILSVIQVVHGVNKLLVQCCKRSCRFHQGLSRFGGARGRGGREGVEEEEAEVRKAKRR